MDENPSEQKYPRSFVPKTPLKAKVIKAIGGRPNGTGDTWTFTTGQLKRLGWTVAVMVGIAFAYGGRLDKYATLPEDLACLSAAVTRVEGENKTEHSSFRQADLVTSERTESIQRDIKYLREDVSFIREQLERRK